MRCFTHVLDFSRVFTHVLDTNMLVSKMRVKTQENNPTRAQCEKICRYYTMLGVKTQTVCVWISRFGMFEACKMQTQRIV